MVTSSRFLVGVVQDIVDQIRASVMVTLRAVSRKKKVTICSIGNPNQFGFIKCNGSDLVAVICSGIVAHVFIYGHHWELQTLVEDTKVRFRFIAIEWRDSFEWEWVNNPSGALKRSYTTLTGETLPGSVDGRTLSGLFHATIQTIIRQHCSVALSSSQYAGINFSTPQLTHVEYFSMSHPHNVESASLSFPETHAQLTDVEDLNSNHESVDGNETSSDGVEEIESRKRSRLDDDIVCFLDLDTSNINPINAGTMLYANIHELSQDDLDDLTDQSSRMNVDDFLTFGMTFDNGEELVSSSFPFTLADNIPYDFNSSDDSPYEIEPISVDESLTIE